MKPYILFLAAVTMAALCQCTNVPAYIMQPGATGNITQVGGVLNLQTAHATMAIDNRESFKAATKVVDNGMIAWAVANIAKSMDANATDVDKANINAQSKAASEASANKAAAEANRHAEAMAETVVEAPIPTP